MGEDQTKNLYIANGSISEVEYLIILLNDLHIIDKEVYHSLSSKCIEIKKMVTSLIMKIRTRF